MNPQSIEVAADHLARFYHEEPDDGTAHDDARGMLRDDQLAAARDAFADLLAAELPDGTLTEFVRRHANRLAGRDEYARRFLERAAGALDEEIRLRESGY